MRLHGSVSGPLAEYLELTVEVGTGGSFDDCSGFSPGATAFDDGLHDFRDAHSDWSTALPVFSATSSGDQRTLRFTLVVDSDPDAEGLTATATFRVEAQA